MNTVDRDIGAVVTDVRMTIDYIDSLHVKGDMYSRMFVPVVQLVSHVRTAIWNSLR
jgi:hypothetical protein